MCAKHRFTTFPSNTIPQYFPLSICTHTVDAKQQVDRVVE